MPIKLLGHKSWHVWKKENIAKVKRDEQRHEEEQRRKRKRQREDKNEERLKKLQVESGEGSSSRSHVNFFESEEHTNELRTNEEYVKEEEKRKQKELRRSGLAPVRLGGDNASERRKPWYNLPADEEIPVRGAFGHRLNGTAAESRRERETGRKSVSDPLLEMKRYISETAAVEKDQDYETRRSSSGRRKKSARKDRKKKKKHKKRKSKSSSSIS
mmetsp:Transcript_2692/g.3131  ORF Transcript_2692/g.3131 Transcript_2692/m.3131 type:complete len:215 (+) Transcript_2692:153-797(+)